MSGEETSQRVERFLKRLNSVPELTMRIALWREVFQTKHPDVVLDLALGVMDSDTFSLQTRRLGLLAFSRYLNEDRTTARKVLLPAAVVRGCADLILLLVDEPAVRVADPSELETPPLDLDREITLGERRSWARSTDRNKMDRLLTDSDPIVIRNLLQNPRLVEVDVLRIASRRPCTAETLIEVFSSHRWIGRRTVQLALLQNPYLPTEIALTLLEVCDEVGLREVTKATTIHPLVVARAKTRLRRIRDNDEPHQLFLDDWTANLLERREQSEQEPLSGPSGQSEPEG